MDRMREGRILDPMETPRASALRRAGVPDAGDLRRERAAAARYDDRATLEAVPIGWRKTDTSNQTITSVAYTLLTNSAFEFSLGGGRDVGWILSFGWRVVIASTGTADDDVYAVALFDVGDGVWRQPDVDVDGVHGAVTAFAPEAYGESAATGTGFSLYAPAVIKMGGGGTVRIAAAVGVGAAGQSAVVSLATARLAPHCVGFALPFQRSR